MIYNSRNWSNGTTESQKEKRPVVLMLIFSKSVKNHGIKLTYTSQYSVCVCVCVCVCVNMKKSFNENFLNSLTLNEKHVTRSKK